jgi:signal transduction histidine kinase
MRVYLAPFIVGSVLFGLLGCWVGSEQRQAQVTAFEALSEESSSVSAALEGSLQVGIRRGCFMRERFQSLLDNVVKTAGIRFVSLRQSNAWSFKAGQPTGQIEGLSGKGFRLEDDVFIGWRTLRLQDCGSGMGQGMGQGMGPGMGQGFGPRHGEGRWAEALDGEVKGEQVLVVGLSTERYHEAIEEARRRSWILLGVGVLALLGTMGAWFTTLRGRALAQRLQQEQARAAHLEELSLAAAGLAHETRNPLNVVRGLAQQLAEDESLPAPVRERTEAIVEEADRATARLSDFLAYARSRPPKPESVDAEALIKRVSDLLRPDYEAAGIRLDIRAEPLRLRVDPEQFQQVLMNVLLNAQAATPAGKSVAVRLARDGAGAMLEVRDEGRGIPDEICTRLFQPYVSGRAGGHGLGLAIVKRIADAHGWRIEVHSATDTGTRFVFGGLALAEGSAS